MRGRGPWVGTNPTLLPADANDFAAPNSAIACKGKPLHGDSLHHRAKQRVMRPTGEQVAKRGDDGDRDDIVVVGEAGPCRIAQPPAEMRDCPGEGVIMVEDSGEEIERLIGPASLLELHIVKQGIADHMRISLCRSWLIQGREGRSISSRLISTASAATTAGEVFRTALNHGDRRRAVARPAATLGFR